MKKNDNVQKYAAIDIGSNAVRLLIANVIQTSEKISIKKSALVRVPIRLGADVFTKNEISNYNKKRLVKAMKAYALLMDVNHVVQYRACATSAMRSASNGKKIVAKIAEEVGINIEIIDGKEEASIIFSTDLKNYINKKKAYIYIDVGGGSTEVTILDKGKIINSKSFNIGSVRLLNNLVHPDIWKDIKSFVKENTKKIKKIEAIGTGGNINKLFKMSQKPIGTPLTYKEIKERYHELERLSYDEKINDLGLNPDRADVIVPAISIYKNILKWADCSKIYVPKVGLSDGMIKKIVYNL